MPLAGGRRRRFAGIGLSLPVSRTTAKNEMVIIRMKLVCLLCWLLIQDGTACGQTWSPVVVAQANIKGGFKSALGQFEVDCGRYPSTAEGLAALITRPTNTMTGRWQGPYLEKIPLDPWRHQYRYLCPGIHNPNAYDLYSWGADGISKTQGNDPDDIPNWDRPSPIGGGGVKSPLVPEGYYYFSAPFVLAAILQGLIGWFKTAKFRRASLIKMWMGISSMFWLPMGLILLGHAPIIFAIGFSPILFAWWCAGLVPALSGLRSGTRVGTFAGLVTAFELTWLLFMPPVAGT